MVNQFDITKCGKCIGHATVELQGLYYQIHCSCREPERIVLKQETGFRDLGVCVPDGEYFRIHTKIPAKYLPGQTWLFAGKNEEADFTPIREEEPFQNIAELSQQKLVCQDGEPGIQTDISNPTGQWSEPDTSE